MFPRIASISRKDFNLSRQHCRLGEIALRNFVVERLRQKYCLSEASLFLYSEDDKILAEYGKHILKIASESLTEEFGKGYSVTNLKSFRKFYLIFKDCAIGQTVSYQFNDSKRQAMPAQLENSKQQALPTILSWSHYERLMRIKEKEIRDWYMIEAANQMWNYRTLNRNINTQYYERMLISQKKTFVENEMKAKTNAFQNDKLEFIKNPTVLEFLGLPMAL